MSLFLPEKHPLFKKYANQYEQDRINGLNSSYKGDFYSKRDQEDYYNNEFRKNMKELPSRVMEELLDAQNSEKINKNYPTFDNIINQDVTKEQLIDNLFDYIDNNDVDYDFYDQHEQDPYAEELLPPEMVREMNRDLYKKQILKMLESK
jgi:hypothetical protein